MTINDKIQNHLDKAYALARKELERMVREAMRKNSNVTDFIMAMGGAIFKLKHEKESVYPEERPYLKHIADYLFKWDDSLRLTGDPMWISGPDGKIKTQW